MPITEKISYCFIAFICSTIIFFTGCDSNSRQNGGSNPDTTDPTIEVATNVGPVATLLTETAYNKAEDIRSNIYSYVDDMLGDPDDNQFLLFVNDDPDEQIYDAEIDISESALECDTGGTKEIIGSLDLSYNSATGVGSFTGQFTIQFSNCQEIVLMQTSNGNCTITPTVDGLMPFTITSDFRLSNEDFNQQVNDTTDLDGSESSFEISVQSSASTQSFSFSYLFSTTSSDNNFIGSADYQNDRYDLPTLLAYISNTATTSICE